MSASHDKMIIEHGLHPETLNFFLIPRFVEMGYITPLSGRDSMRQLDAGIGPEETLSFCQNGPLSSR
jgi:hypothetical protein